jgi:hypothetical protein
MSQQHPISVVAYAAIILVVAEVALFNPAIAQEATTAPATTDPATTAPASTAPAVPAAAPPAPVAAAEPAAAPTSPPISADIITPDVIKDMRERIVQPVTIMSILAANKVHTGIDQAAIDKMDAAWKTEAKSDDQPFIAEILSSPLSNYLLYIQASSAGLFTEIFVMDKFGLNVGQSSVTSDYWQGDEDKYQKTFAVGPDAVFVDEPEFDDKTKTWRTQVDFTVVDPETKQSIGAVTVEFNLTELQRRLQS